MNRFESQYRFLVEADRLKSVYRKSRLYSESDRYENSAEHSWHLALMAMVFSEYANDDIDLLKVIKMIVIHDLVEIYAGDTMIYFKHRDQEEREKKSAERLFGLLPGDQKSEFVALWDEFCSQETPESKFANAIDKFQPATQSMENGCMDWNDYNIKYADIVRVNRRIQKGCETLWDYVSQEIERCRKKGMIE